MGAVGFESDFPRPWWRHSGLSLASSPPEDVSASHSSTTRCRTRVPAAPEKYKAAAIVSGFSALESRPVTESMTRKQSIIVNNIVLFGFNVGCILL